MTTPRRSESFDRYQERALSERCAWTGPHGEACLHQRRQHVADCDYDDGVWVPYDGPCEVSNCPCRKFFEMEDES